MVDALASYQPKENSIWLKFNDGDAIKMRILTLDPLITEKIWDNAPDKIDTKYSFIVWNWDEEKAQVLKVGPGLLNRFTRIHRDEDYDPLNKIDIKITATGEMLERRYEVDVLPKAKELTPAMVADAQLLKLEDLLPDNKGRLSEYENEGEDNLVDDSDDSPGLAKARATAKKIKGETDEDEVLDVDPEKEIQLSDIPF